MSDSGDTSPDGRLNSSSLTDDLDKSMGSLTTQESPIRFVCTDEIEAPRVHEPHPIIPTKTDTEIVHKSNSSQGLKETFSQAMLHSDLYQSLPKYIFQSDHQPLQRVKTIYDEAKCQQQREIEIDESFGDSDCGLSEYPIEHIEQQEKALKRQMSSKQEIKQKIELKEEQEENIKTESHSFYNKIQIDEDPESSELEEIDTCSQFLVKSMIIREKYMMLCRQSFSYTTAKYLNRVFTEDRGDREVKEDFFDQTNEENPIDPPKPEGDPFDIEVLPKLDFKLEIEGGVVKVKNSDGTPHSKFVYPELKMFIDDYHLLVNLISNGPL